MGDGGWGMEGDGEMGEGERGKGRGSWGLTQVFTGPPMLIPSKTCTLSSEGYGFSLIWGTGIVQVHMGVQV